MVSYSESTDIKLKKKIKHNFLTNNSHLETNLFSFI